MISNTFYSFLKICFSTIFLHTFIGLNHMEARLPVLDTKQLLTPPPKIIRPCCSFGSDLNLAFFPVKVTNITGVDIMGKHTFLGNKSEGNGIIYTKRGGFIDLGHLRDQADWTAYLASHILSQPNKAVIWQRLGYEGGEKWLSIENASQLDSLDIYQLAGKIAYDLSVWHEIATWFGASYLPFLPERYSSFSIEDAYSNLLGIHIGIAALQSDLPYEEAIDKILMERLQELEAVPSIVETFNAMEKVESIWWTRSKRLPNKKVLLQRQLEVNKQLTPWLVQGWESEFPPIPLNIPQVTSTGEQLNDFYFFQIKLNQKVPFKKIFPQRLTRRISSQDFDVLIDWVSDELEQQQQKDEAKYLRQKNRKETKEKRL